MVSAQLSGAGAEVKDLAALNEQLLVACVANCGRTINGKSMTVGEASQYQNGNAVPGGCHDYLPFGEEIYPPVGQRSTSCYPTNFKSGMLFTGKLRDAWGESQLDYFGARYFSGAQGRFTSPDPKEPTVRHVANSQKWNKYSYTLNNPLKYIDPDGLEEVTVTYRTFIPSSSVTVLEKTNGGNARGFRIASNASSRTSISVRLETGPFA